MDTAEVTAANRQQLELPQADANFCTPTSDADELLRGYLPYDQMKAIVAEKRD